MIRLTPGAVVEPFTESREFPGANVNIDAGAGEHLVFTSATIYVSILGGVTRIFIAVIEAGPTGVVADKSGPSGFDRIDIPATTVITAGNRLRLAAIGWDASATIRYAVTGFKVRT